jgi:serine/threonine protein kinase
VDIWAIGVLAFEMLTGKAPFYHISRQETMKSIVKVQIIVCSAILAFQKICPNPLEGLSPRRSNAVRE